MGQVLRIAIVFIAIWFAWRLLRRTLSNHKNDAAPPAPGDMLRCQYCGVFVPRNDAIAAGSHFYCCTAHAEADRKQT